MAVATLLVLGYMYYKRRNTTASRVPQRAVGRSGTDTSEPTFSSEAEGIDPMELRRLQREFEEFSRHDNSGGSEKVTARF